MFTFSFFGKHAKKTFPRHINFWAATYTYAGCILHNQHIVHIALNMSGMYCAMPDPQSSMLWPDKLYPLFFT